MSAWPSLAALAWRESRNTRRRLLAYMSSICLGVAALVAIDSYSANIKASIEEQSRALLGGDLAISSRQQFPPRLDSLIDSIAVGDIAVARQTSFPSMALAPRSGLTRLVQVRAVSEGYPLYGIVVTEPAAAWSEFQSGANVIVDPGILASLRVAVGDSLRIGVQSFVIAGTIREVPGDPGVLAAIGPRVLMPFQRLEETQLLAFGGVANREALLKVPPSLAPQVLLRQIRREMDSVNVRGRTASQTENNLTESIDELANFLGLVGLIALLLGGIGVASGVNAHIARKVETVAILRSIGATSIQVLAMYASQAAVMGILGAAIGAAMGVGVQFLLPVALGEFLPVDVQIAVAWNVVAVGIAVGGFVGLAFALLPLLGVRHISPLQALRKSAPQGGRRSAVFDPARIAVVIILLGSLVAVAAARTDDFMEGLGMTAGVVGVIIVLTLVAIVATWLARKMVSPTWPYVVRQGIANLYRPGNQTRPVVLALGFGAFLISSLYLVQISLLQQFEGLAEASRGNLLLFDVQEDQEAGVDSILLQAGAEVLESTPIVTMRITAINSELVRDIMARDGRGGRSWPLRREYRSTFADSLGGRQNVVEGNRFGSGNIPEGYAEVSFERDVAMEMQLALGDTVVWDVQGVEVPTIVTSFREVNWGRLETNFFAVFGPGSIEAAPRQYAMLASVSDAELARVQGQIVDRFANVSAIDLTLVAQTIASVQGKAEMAIRFTALFSLAMGIPVLVGAVAATRRERIREGVLLRTLGASRKQIRRIMLAEYTVLGALGTLAGMALGIAGAWALTYFIFEQVFIPFSWELAVVALGMITITAIIGLVSGRDVYRTTPADALREA